MIFIVQDSFGGIAGSHFLNILMVIKYISSLFRVCVCVCVCMPECVYFLFYLTVKNRGEDPIWYNLS